MIEPATPSDLEALKFLRPPAPLSSAKAAALAAALAAFEAVHSLDAEHKNKEQTDNSQKNIFGGDASLDAPLRLTKAMATRTKSPRAAHIYRNLYRNRNLLAASLAVLLAIPVAVYLGPPDHRASEDAAPVSDQAPPFESADAALKRVERPAAPQDAPLRAPARESVGEFAKIPVLAQGAEAIKAAMHKTMTRSDPPNPPDLAFSGKLSARDGDLEASRLWTCARWIFASPSGGDFYGAVSAAQMLSYQFGWMHFSGASVFGAGGAANFWMCGQWTSASAGLADVSDLPHSGVVNKLGQGEISGMFGFGGKLTRPEMTAP